MADDAVERRVLDALRQQLALSRAQQTRLGDTLTRVLVLLDDTAGS